MADNGGPERVDADWRDGDDDGLGADRAAEERETLASAQRDVPAFAPIYQRYYRSVFDYCHCRLEHRDATSQTYARALAGIDGFRNGSVPDWLFTIARNVVIDTVRSRRDHVDIDAAVDLSDHRLLPEEEANAGDQQRALFAALRTSTPDQRHVVELRLVGRSIPGVVAVLDHARCRQGQPASRLPSPADGPCQRADLRRPDMTTNDDQRPTDPRQAEALDAFPNGIVQGERSRRPDLGPALARAAREM